MKRAIHDYLVFLQRCGRIAFVGDWRYYLWMGALSAVCLLGLNAYAKQLAHGLITTGMSDQVSWGVYIANFTFLVGVAAAAVMMVIPVYIYDNEELHDLVIFGELLAVATILMCLAFVTVDLGRPDRFWHLIPGLGQLNFPASMLSWDVIVLNGYLLLNVHICGYLLYCRYRGRKPSKWFYIPFVFVAIGWAVSIHTVTAFLYVGLGGLAGDCGQYVGEVVGVPATGQGTTISYRVPTSREGAVWATGGPVIDSTGTVYVSTGNGASTTTYDGTDSVLELSPALGLLSRFAPTTWATDNAGDADLGSLSPVLVPGGWVFIAGKSGTGYVLHQGALGGIGGQVSSAFVCTGFGGAAFSGDTIFVPCESSVRQVRVGSDGSLQVGWRSDAAGGPPVLGGGAVWSVNTSTGTLVALNPDTGATLASISVGDVPHFASPTLRGTQILVGTMSGITSVSTR